MTESKRILVVDDHVYIGEMLEELLSDEGYELTLVKNGEEALEVYNSFAFPLVISDINLGGMTGLDLLDKITRMNPDTQMVIISGDSSPETRQKALNGGAADFLPKPFEDLLLVIDTVNQVMGRG